MASLLRRIPWWGRRPPSAPRVFANPNFERISADCRIEEETFSDYVAARYYPVHIGEVFISRYQVVGKLGYGAYSTVWLARDLNEHRHVALKIFIRSQSMGSDAERELRIYQHMAEVSSKSKHPGRKAVRTLLDSFKVVGPDGEHQCLVHPPLWESVKGLIGRNPIGRLPSPVLGIILHRLFLALDFLHTECHLIHTDLKIDNIMFGAEDDSIFEKFEEAELNNPSPRKEVEGGRFIYVSRQLDAPKELAPPVLCDFGSVVSGEQVNTRDVQPDLYRSPEVILDMPWSYEIDIWNVGCMVWDMFEGGHLFSGRDPEHHAYRSRAHLASIIGLLGLPPRELIARGKRGAEFFSEKGDFKANIPLPPPRSLEQIETNLQGDDKERFLQLMRKMLRWVPEQRCSAKELLQDAWLKGQL
ncbi:uncharacterized protein THITE_2106524 [Thermothielavioides terrestris NRRL 8126]|uniref:non-specific serine/threonine protein kinase n=1 Tax=Thermothielavioides terrestris (strain ATCC 38088 / NRRL 8126) TaxID=578455 RepID=G2QQJ5_THETT|nr:uncharacterized protein THITE_2106524 [Thermothielavioides terrestris NRRL 8126]AEO62405.1 hypothetical protein THITE_2106524 [Thermothielavioides terrestris NRRL 8126]